jgi:sugar diacid utilization regulator
VRSLLAGEADRHPGVAYELDAWHVGIVAIGSGAEAAVAGLAKALDAELLMVPADQEGDSIWAWIGRRRRPMISEVVSAWVDDEVAVAIGEPRREVEGWRLSHREALAALQVMLLSPCNLVRARDVLVVAAVLRDEALAAGLAETYLAPLSGRGDTEAVLRETLRAYFNVGQNAATAAAVLKVNRHTVERRLRGIEDKLGQHVNSCRAQLEVALAIEALQTPERR